MSLNVEKLDGNMAKLTIELEAGKVEDAITRAYQRIKNQVSLPGFRKGKVPQKMVEKQYGVEDTEDLETKAEAFAIRAGGRTPRVARQFIEQVRSGVL